MCSKLGRGSSLKDYQTKVYDIKGNKTRDFLKDLFIAEISQLLQNNTIFAAFRITKIDIQACSEQTVTDIALWYSF